MFENIRNVNRLREVLMVFFEEGFGFVIARAGLSGLIPLSRRLKDRFRKEEYSAPVRLRKSFEKLGPVFVKFGQFLSLRPDIVPPEYVVELEKLQDSAPSFSFNEVKREIEESVGPISKFFREFDRKPVASASVSQVHKARLKNNRLVAVKVQRPDAKKNFERDISLMLFIAVLLERHFKVFRRYNIINAVNEFKGWSSDEVDFRVEASNAKVLRENFKSSGSVVIPEIFYSSERVLVMEYIDGVELSDVSAVRKLKKDYKHYVDSAYDAVLTMIFDHGFFHGDPHPSNILVLRKSDKIAFIDFGIMGSFDDKLKYQSLHMFNSIIRGDVDSLVRSLVSLSQLSPGDVDETALKRDLRVIINEVRFSSLKDIEVSRILAKALDISLTHRIVFPLDFVLFAKTVVTLEGVGLRYNPDFRLVEQSRPLIEKLLRKRFGPKGVLSDVKNAAAAYRQLVDSLPDALVDVLNRLRKGKVKIDIEDTNVHNLIVEMEKSSGNLTLGLIVASLIIGSSLVWQIAYQPAFLGLPVIPVIGICFAGLLSVWILHRALFSK